MLYGRDSERERLRALVRRAGEGRSFAILLEGPAGIGKTALLEDALDASPDGAQLLRAIGHETETEIPYAGLAALLAPVLGLRAQLPAAQRAALGAALALEPSGEGDRFSVPVALLGLLGLAAEEWPLLLAVDDAQWLDAASREAIVFAAQRLDADAIGVLIAVREGSRAPLEAPGLRRLPVRPLAESQARALLADGVELAPEVAARLLTAAGGNPLALRELPRALSPAQRAGHAPLERPPATDGEAAAAFAEQLAGLPEEAAEPLAVVAAAGGAPERVVVAALERLGRGPESLSPALAAGLLERRGDRLELRHPLLASAAYHRAPSARRRAAHAALAAVLADGPRRAWQLAAAALGTDEAAAAALRGAAGEARGRGAHAEAARAFARAAELTGDAERRAALELEAARDHALAGRGDPALELAERAAREAADPVLAAAARQLRAHLLMRGGKPAAGIELLLALAEEEAAAGEPAAAARLILEASLGHMFAGDMEALLRLSERAREEAEDAAPELALLASLAGGEALLALGRSAAGEERIAAAEPLLFAADPLADTAELVTMAAMSSLWVERFERAERILGAMVGRAREAGAAGRLVYPLAGRAQLHWRRGRWAAAYADAEEGAKLAAETGQQGVLSLSLALLARSEAGIGHIEEARAHAREGIELAALAAGDATVLHGVAALGFAELSAGRADLAVAPLERAAAIEERLGLGEPALTTYAADLVEALARAGRPDDARARLEALAAGAARTGGAWAHAATERGWLLLGGEEELEDRAEAAFAWHDRVEMPFERARTELVLGERLRRARRRADSRQWLERAQRGFEGLGAEPWAARARTELRATGGRAATAATAPVEELTPAELQVALLVAEGRTNREAAAALFLSPKTIEHHLGAIYRKLGLRSRAQLAGLLADQLASPGRTAPVS